MARILVTRAEPEAADTVERLNELGHTALASPMLRIRAYGGIVLDLAGVQALLFTSAAGVRAFTSVDKRRHLPAFCVGEATAQAAQKAGFAEAFAGAAGVAALADLAAAQLDPAAGRLLHISGAQIAGDLRAALQTRGFDVERRTLYVAESVTRLVPAAEAALRAQPCALDFVLLYSAGGARAFVRAIRRAQLIEQIRGVTALCISPAAALAAEKLPWCSVQSARVPREYSLFALLAPATDAQA